MHGALPSGAIYKRSEDGIVLVDQDRCRGWRQCITGCPYKKIYFNHKTGKAEKCTFCYPRVEVGLPTVCSETCVGRLRYLGLVLYDADWVTQAAATSTPAISTRRSFDVMLDPDDAAVVAQARADGIPEDWLKAPAARGLRPRQASPRRPAAAPWSTAPCRWSGTCRRCPPSSTSWPLRDTTPRTGRPVRRDRRAPDPRRVPRRALHRGAHRHRDRCLAEAAAMRAYMRR